MGLELFPGILWPLSAEVKIKISLPWTLAVTSDSEARGGPRNLSLIYYWLQNAFSTTHISETFNLFTVHSKCFYPCVLFAANKAFPMLCRCLGTQTRAATVAATLPTVLLLLALAGCEILSLERFFYTSCLSKHCFSIFLGPIKTFYIFFLKIIFLLPTRW